MNAVAKAAQPITVDLKATRELRRDLTVMYETGGNGYWWAGAYPPGKWRTGTQCIAYAGAFDPKDICIHELQDDGRFDLNVSGTAFPITRAEADRLVAAFGFEVKKPVSDRTYGDQDTGAPICEHGVDLDKERCAKCNEHEAEHDRVFEGERS